MGIAKDDFEILLGQTSVDSPSFTLDTVDNRQTALSLAARGFVVFPLCQWPSNDPDEWTPIKHFQRLASADKGQIQTWWSRWPNARVGLLTGERNGVTVLDLDRKKGKDGIASLSALGFDDLEALSPVRVRTPSGGWHLYFQYDPRLRNWVSELGDGIDVKTEGGLVMAPGSFKSGGRYEPVGAALGTVELPAIPEALIPCPDIRRQSSPVKPLTEPSEWQCDQVTAELNYRATLLAQVGEGSRNDALNQAAFWAGSNGAHGFLDEDGACATLWAAAEAIGIAKREFRATFRSGWKGGMKKPNDRIPIDTSADEYGELDDEFALLLGDTGPETLPACDDEWDGGDLADEPTRRLNKLHAVVRMRGRALITTEHTDGSIDFMTRADLNTLYANDRVRGANDKMHSVAAHWLAAEGRRTKFGGVTFAPGGCADDTLNLWRGWSVEPNADASCALFLHHVRKVVCRGIAEHADYLIGWLAHMVQRPSEKPGVALVLRGAKGAGKDTVADYVARMIGRRHAPTVAESDHIVGKFNARLENALLLHVQEGTWAGDRKAESTLKYLVTSDYVEIERKGIDSFNVPSVLRIFISANAEWVVPASRDERRWAVFEVADRHCGDESYFTALRAEMNGTGPAALLHYLQSYDLTGFNVRKAPETEGLLQQKLASLRGLDLWWFETLHRGVIPTGFGSESEWAAAPQTVSRDGLRTEYATWSKARRFDGEIATDAVFGRRMRELVPGLRDSRPRTAGGRIWQYVVPPLTDCRSAFDAWIGAVVDWEVDKAS